VYLFNFLIVAVLSFAQMKDPVAVVGIDKPEVTNPLQITSVSNAPDDTMPGSRFPILLSLTLPKGFHAYEDKMKVRVLQPEGTSVSDLILKPSQEFLDFSGKAHKGLVEKGTLEFFMEIPKDAGNLKELKFELEYIACTLKYCLTPQVVPFSSTINTPKANMADASFIEEKLQSNLLLAFLIVFAFGVLTSLTPCVYPLIPITLAVIGTRTTQRKKSHAFLLSVVYVHGIATTYSILGVIAASTGALFGQALSYPPVIIFFSFLFFLMGLSLFGLFEIRAPHFITAKLGTNKNSEGYLGAYLTGLVAGVIASPCVGPVLVGILAYIAETQNVILGFTLLFTFAMGMGMLFIALGTFSSLGRKLPKSGPWMNGIKYALGLAMIGLGLWYLKPLVTKGSLAPASIASKVPLKNGWKLYSEELVEQARKDGKVVMIDFYADWCGACVELDEKTFSTPQFIAQSKDFVLLKVDATESFEGLGELQKKYDVFGLPTVVFVSKSGQLIKDLTLTGFEEVDRVSARMTDAQKRP